MKKSKPDILIVLAVVIGFGIIVTEAVHAFSGKTKPVVTAARR